MHYFPNFAQLLVCFWSPPNFPEKIILNSLSDSSQIFMFFRVSDRSFINFLWWYHVYLILCDPWCLALICLAHLNKWSPLPDFIDLFQQVNSFSRELNLGYRMMVSVGRCVLMGEITAHALRSGCAGGWASWLDGSWSGSTLKWGHWVIFLVWQCCWMYSVLRWCHWLGPTSVQAGSQAVSLCSMAGWCHWFDSSVCHNYEVMLCNCSCLSGACLDGVTPCWGGTSGWALQSGRHWLCPIIAWRC